MHKMNMKRTSSIARHINWSWLGRLLFIFLLLDCIVMWICLGDELKACFGNDNPWGVFVEDGNFILVLREYLPLFIAEGILWLFYMLFGTGKVRRRLRPLYEMADTALFLEQDGLDEERFHDLENAIDSLSPTRDDAKLHTGDKELQGLEQAVNNLLERMRASYRQQARFVSDASHELRTPIAVIQGYANMLDRWGKEDEKVLEESIEAIKSEAEHMKKLVEQLLFLARGDSGKMSLHKEVFDAVAWMEDIRDESILIDEKHTYVLQAAKPVFAYGDVSLLKQTIRILVENAAKYTMEGESILLRVRNREEGVTELTVQDNGIGMAQADIPHVFERFYRVDSSRVRQTGGTGLGLAIAKWIVGKHGGWFEVLSRENIGTRISVCLPPLDTELQT